MRRSHRRRGLAVVAAGSLSPIASAICGLKVRFNLTVVTEGGGGGGACCGVSGGFCFSFPLVYELRWKVVFPMVEGIVALLPRGVLGLAWRGTKWCFYELGRVSTWNRRGRKVPLLVTCGLASPGRYVTCSHDFSCPLLLHRPPSFICFCLLIND